MFNTLWLVALYFASALALPTSLGYFPARSADIIIQSEKSTIQDSVIYFRGDQMSTTELDQIKDTQFSDIFSHVMGLQPFHLDADRTGFPTTTLFKKPRAAAIVVIDSIGTEALHSHSTLNFPQKGHSASINVEYLPANTQAILANLVTGNTPSIHGIVGPAWRALSTGEFVRAYDNKGGLPVSANIADILIQEFDGLSLIVSASASSSFASALAVHPELIRSNAGYHAHAYSFSHDGALESRYTRPSCDQLFALSATDLSELVNAIMADADFTFKTTKPADHMLLVELATIKHITTMLRSDASLSALTKDGAPDLYSFVFSSLKEIEKLYGKDSKTYSIALNLVDKATESFFAALEAIYDNSVAGAVIALNARDTTSDTIKSAVHEKVKKFLYSQQDFEIFFPMIYVRTFEFEGDTRDAVCDSLQATVEDTATVVCLSPFQAVRGLRGIPHNSSSSFSSFDNGSSSSSSFSDSFEDGEDGDPVWTFWLHFFVTLVIVNFIGWGIYCLAYVGSDASKDSLLFRATGRHQHQN